MWRRTCALLLVLQYIFASVGLAQSTPISVPTPTPAPVQKPQLLYKPEPACTRSFIYRNRTLPVDSSRKMDAEGMRFVLKKNSQSEQMLNDYQSQLKASYIPAYSATLGIALAVGGPLYASTLHTDLGRRDTRAVLFFSGIFLAIASYTYGQYAIKRKEKTLEKAVNVYNDSAPALEKISVGLTPVPTGTGGEIKTQVPFSF